MPAATVKIDMLGRSSIYRPRPNATCEKLSLSHKGVARAHNPVNLLIAVSDDIGYLPPLSTFHTTLQLEGADSEKVSCRQANITPALGSTTVSIVTYSTWAIFLFVLLVGFVRSAYSTPVLLDDEEVRTIRTVLPNVGDCLQYIQFIFLTGGLSLRYPGFYQPVVSNLNWFSLFLNGPVTHGVVYDSIKDGIYVMNGTYGGTFGLELMTQIAGAPMTMDTWLNMVVLMFTIVIGMALIVEVFWFLNRGRDSDSELPRSAGGFRHTCSRVLRVVLSYFMLPLAALSFYQLDNASILPAWHTSMSATLIVSMMAAFMWLIRRISTRSLGVLVFDSAKRYRQIDPSEGLRRHDETFILVLFALVFVRGAAIGGLQISGIAQLAVLGACELVLLASIAGFQAYSTFSIGTMAATMRLCSLVFLVAFLPDLATNDVKSVIGYVLLGIHGCMLVFGFFIPAVCDVSSLLMDWWKAPRPHAYGLRQLRRRQVSRTNLSSVYTENEPYSSYPEPDAIDEPNAGHLRPVYRSDSPSTLQLESPTTSSRYYRQPRSPSQSASVSSSGRYRRAESTLNGSSVSSAYPPSRTTSTSINLADKRSVQRSESTISPSRLSESTEEEPSSPSLGSPTSFNGGPLGPRWNDYSFREADLYYGIPHQPPAERASEDTPQTHAPRPSLRSSSSELWARVTKQSNPVEQGFQVVRPGRPSSLGDGRKS
ncbi:putative membrane protein C1322.03-like protein 1 [Colletotrichum chlorophyti]|uniref:Putative membrane protein C1322.03-like protein 1 n=1 Tax=Colletotrichum chlorophyti TaxID=708187 RepID=A0A1Q8S4J2_9PEZI|nr:putative membrane protein C1322.03-like protein 1 [Colletotrichum chlorophyti]